MTRTRIRTQSGGFTLVEVLIAMLVTIIGLAGVMIMQATAIRANREASQFTRAASLAEEGMEKTRSLTMAQITALVVDDVTVNNIVYITTITVEDISGQDNLQLVTIAVTYDEAGDEDSAEDDKKAVAQMVRTKSEQL